MSFVVKKPTVTQPLFMLSIFQYIYCMVETKAMRQSIEEEIERERDRKRERERGGGRGHFWNRDAVGRARGVCNFYYFVLFTPPHLSLPFLTPFLSLYPLFSFSHTHFIFHSQTLSLSLSRSLHFSLSLSLNYLGQPKRGKSQKQKKKKIRKSYPFEGNVVWLEATINSRSMILFI